MGFVYNEQADAGAPEREDELQDRDARGRRRASSPPQFAPPLDLQRSSGESPEWSVAASKTEL